MCIIAYKPLNVAFPEENILKNCWDNNDHGAGFMYAYEGVVHFQKGYETWEAFKSALNRARKLTGDKVPYVMHFRIATQGYEKTMTHPFPLSSNMKKLKKLHGDCNIGVAHNGIIDLTSDGAKEYSDTMKFITDYLSLIIRNYSWYKDERTTTLIERLIDGSRLAILDKKGHCQLLGKGWVEENGMWYSNTSYEKRVYTYPSCSYNSLWDYDDYDDYWARKYDTPKGDNNTEKYYLEDPSDPWGDFFNPITGKFELEDLYCPYSEEGDDSYCSCCANAHKCPYLNFQQNAVNK